MPNSWIILTNSQLYLLQKRVLCSNIFSRNNWGWKCKILNSKQIQLSGCQEQGTMSCFQLSQRRTVRFDTTEVRHLYVFGSVICPRVFLPYSSLSVNVLCNMGPVVLKVMLVMSFDCWRYYESFQKIFPLDFILGAEGDRDVFRNKPELWIEPLSDE